jgi:hypothetical protein
LDIAQANDLEMEGKKKPLQEMIRASSDGTDLGVWIQDI